jgi:hypothetical protein
VPPLTGAGYDATYELQITRTQALDQIR